MFPRCSLFFVVLILVSTSSIHAFEELNVLERLEDLFKRATTAQPQLKPKQASSFKIAGNADGMLGSTASPSPGVSAASYIVWTTYKSHECTDTRTQMALRLGACLHGSIMSYDFATNMLTRRVFDLLDTRCEGSNPTEDTYPMPIMGGGNGPIMGCDSNDDGPGIIENGASMTLEVASSFSQIRRFWPVTPG